MPDRPPEQPGLPEPREHRDDAPHPPGLFDAARLDEVPPGSLLGVTAPDGTPICLVNVRGEVRALRDQCTHRGFPLSAGELLPDGTIQCPWHGARFDALTGAVRGGPACDPVPVHVTTVAAGVIAVGRPIPRHLVDGGERDRDA